MNKAELGKRLLFTTWAAPLGWWFINSRFNLIPHEFSANVLHMPGFSLFPGQVLAMTLAFMALYEYTGMLAKTVPRNGFWIAFIWMGFQFVTHFIAGISFSMKVDLYILLLLVAFEAIVWGRESSRWKRASLLFSGTIFLTLAGFSLLAFYEAPFEIIFISPFKTSMLSQLGLVTVYGAVVACDSAAYFIGSLIGKHKLTSISPRKTIEGSIAGLIAAMIVVLVGWYFLASPRYPLFLGALLGLLVGFFAQAGDLLVSTIKRYFQVKDASDIIPGHGGVLDRFDSIFFAAPIINLFCILTVKFFS